MKQPEQEYLTPHDMLREELTDERLLTNHLILALARMSVDGCRRLIESTPDISSQCRQDALDYVDDLIHEGKCG